VDTFNCVACQTILLLFYLRMRYVTNSLVRLNTINNSTKTPGLLVIDLNQQAHALI